MSKHTLQFERRPRDFYESPASVVRSLMPHLAPRTRFVEPAAGAGALIRHLEAEGHQCALATEIDPQHPFQIADARTFDYSGALAECAIGNVPWRRNILHAIILNLSRQMPTWLLFDADWLHTQQAIPFMTRLRKVVSVGRVKWFPESDHESKDSACWYHFSHPIRDCPPLFYPRLPK